MEQKMKSNNKEQENNIRKTPVSIDTYVFKNGKYVFEKDKSFFYLEDVKRITPSTNGKGTAIWFNDGEVIISPLCTSEVGRILKWK